jgi:2-polyprenyl-6-methoxyphenol hydroxylase-like FAD-dependent oxidoreductase
MDHHAAIESVLIVGAGPTGLTLAADLARRGVVARIVEAAPDRSGAVRAINVHSRTLEVFDDLGIADEALAEGNRVHTINVWRASGGSLRRLRRIDLSGLDTAFPFSLTLQQPQTERLLEVCAARHGVRVERPVRCVGLALEEGGVTVRLEHLTSGQVESAHYDWVVGCDGGHSVVREQAGVPFLGKDYREVLVSADVYLDWDLPHDEANVFFSPHGSLRCMPVPGNGRWRLIGELPPEPDGAKPQAPTFDGLQELVRLRGAPAILRSQNWLGTFVIHCRMAPRYRTGRVLLAGDAAHVHSPTGAQGMNFGIQDAYNLGWKLALVVRGRALSELLDSYEAERRPLAERLLERTDKTTRRTHARSPLVRALRNSAIRLGSMQRRQLRGSMELALRYRDSPILDPDGGVLRRGPQPGERAPEFTFGPPAGRRRMHELLRGTRPVALLVAGSDDPSRLAGIVATLEERFGHEVAVLLLDAATDPDRTARRRWGVRGDAAYVVRPDGYVGFRCAPADAARIVSHLDGILVTA